jgi:hypothetical protein
MWPRRVAIALLVLVVSGCASRLEIIVTNETDATYLVALRGEQRTVWEVPPGGAGDIVIAAHEGSSLLLVLTEACDITSRYGVSAGDAYELRITDRGQAEVLSSRAALTGTALSPSELCP